MHTFKPLHALFLAMACFSAGTTVRCNIEDDDDDKKEQRAQLEDALEHMLEEHLGAAGIAAGDEPDFVCQGAGLDDVKRETGFDLFFVHGCNEL